MKSFLFSAAFALVSTTALAQAPAGYYDGTAGLTGSALKTKLSQIITQGHRDNGYGGLYDGYPTTDTDHYYENDGSVLDIYSENPNGTDPYKYTHGSKQCGNYSNEGDCYNREHIVPQSLFSERSPMRNDINFIRPTDGKVNGMRSNYPFGPVSNPTFTSKNGSKLGNSSASGYGGTVFEPINEFKGDVARMIFYFVTRYESQLSGFSTGNMLGGSAFPGLQTWELNVLLQWAAQDPVSPTEVERNNAAYTFQGNRNPYIDHPEWVASVWGPTTPSTPDTVAPTAPLNLTSTGVTANSVALSWTAATDNVGVTAYDIYVNGNFVQTVSGTSTAFTVAGLSANTAYSFYIIAKDAAGNASPQSNTLQATTNDAPATPTSCGTENFETIPTTSSSSYDTRTWTNNNITWTATDARTDQTIENKAITIRNGELSSSTISGGVGSVTVTTQLKFTGSASNLDLYLNNNKVGTVPYSTTATTTTVNGINVAGNAVIRLVNPTNGNRIAIDNLSWSCFTNLGTAETASKKLAIYPNPVKNSEMFISGENLGKVEKVAIYSITGQLMQSFTRPFAGGNKLSFKKLNKGIYLLKLDSETLKFIVE